MLQVQLKKRKKERQDSLGKGKCSLSKTKYPWMEKLESESRAESEYRGQACKTRKKDPVTKSSPAPEEVKQSWQKNKGEGVTLANIMVYDTASIIKTEEETYISMEHNLEPRDKPTQTCLADFFFFFFWVFLLFSTAVPTAYGGSQARGLIGAVAAGLHQSHSNTVSEPCLWPTATPDP